MQKTGKVRKWSAALEAKERNQGSLQLAVCVSQFRVIKKTEKTSGVLREYRRFGRIEQSAQPPGGLPMFGTF